jgi:hypothetical protein
MERAEVPSYLVLAAAFVLASCAVTGNNGTAEGGDYGSVGSGDAGPGDASAGSADPIVLSVATTTDVHPISPLIYGVNPDKVACSNATARFAMCRLGGNPWSTYDWENNASNAGDQLCFQNDDQLGTSNTPAATVTSLIAEAGQSSSAAVITIPIIDFVAADKLRGDPPPSCSRDVRRSTDYLTSRFKRNQARKGSALSDPPDTADAIVSQDEFVRFIKARAGATNVIFTLDNQPELWSQTQAPVHPNHATYEEVVSRNVEYATMVRENWPEAEITGYGGYGYYAFLNLQDAPNRPGNSVFLDYYLAAMQRASTTAGKRLIDYLDIHWYSEARGNGQRILMSDETEAIAQARVQAPRSLWDSGYSEDSWIADSYGPIQLIHWLKDKIATFYPGTKLAISAWSYGGEASISGAIAVADSLGIYGREGVELAALDPDSKDVSFALGGFAVFRNYDGAGAAFGDTSVRATSSDVARVAVYASTDSRAPGRIVVVAINRSSDELPVSLRVESGAGHSAADVYRLTSASATPRPAAALSATAGSSFSTTLPPQSVSVIVPRS